MMRRIPAGMILMAAALMLGACGSPAGPAPTPTATEGEAPAEAPPSPRTDPSNVVPAKDLRPGDTVAGLTVTEVSYYEEQPESGTFGAVVSFAGEVTVTGRYVHQPLENEFSGGEVCMDVDSSTEDRLPRLEGDNRSLWFCFTNRDEAAAYLAPDGIGEATVVIDDYTIDYRPTETWNRATLVKVVDVRYALPWTKHVTLTIEGQKETRTFRLAYHPILPFAAYVPPDWGYEIISEDNRVGVRFLPPDGLGVVEIFSFREGTPREEAEAAAAKMLEGYRSAPVDPPPWALAAFEAEDPQGKRAFLRTGERKGQYFLVFSRLENLEAADGWDATIGAVLREWRWLGTGESLQ
ncbi:MAG: hypothetical protein KM310_08155 [Clostridiales bacterium]|nr:hypothetical protein [Clostridiales bacterium]